MIIDTKLDIAHKELILIFFKANELIGMVVTEEPIEIRGRFHMVLRLESTFQGTSEALTFMGIRHCGVLNMLDDYLLKCGVTWDALQPSSMHRQIQDEREQEENEKFIKDLNNLKHHANIS